VSGPLAGAPLVAFVGASDLATARAFYGGVLGLTLAEETSFACVFDVAGTTLRVTRVAAVAPAPYTVVGWSVADVDATLDALAAAGLEPLRYDGLEQDARGAWRSPSGTRVAWVRDPDGNVLSVTQLAV
jgi:catechol 2,3-dioxygenase-like lactoylglutathione lyase family enzyme